MATRKDLFGCPGESPRLARGIKIQATQNLPDVRFLDIRFLFCLCLRQNANTTLSLQLPMKFGSIVRVETLRYLTKITTLRRKADREQLKFLQPSIRLRYNYYVQLVAIRRDWMRVANLKSRQRGVEAGRAQSCNINRKNPLLLGGRKNPISHLSRMKNPKLPYLHVTAAL
jgi:hypothetical protein